MIARPAATHLVAPVPPAAATANPGPRPIADVMGDVLARYGLAGYGLAGCGLNIPAREGAKTSPHPFRVPLASRQ